MNVPALSTRIRIARRIGFAAWAALALLQLSWHAAWDGDGIASRLPALALSLLPLALPLLALRRPPRALLLAGMLALFYFTHGVAEVWSDPATRTWAWLEIVLSLALVGAIGASVQRRARRS